MNWRPVRDNKYLSDHFAIQLFGRWWPRYAVLDWHSFLFIGHGLIELTVINDTISSTQNPNKVVLILALFQLDAFVIRSTQTI
jgi:hypothetical protein